MENATTQQLARDGRADFDFEVGRWKVRSRRLRGVLQGSAAWEEFERARQDRPYPRPEPGADEEGLEKQRQLEERYFSPEALAKYRGT